MDIKYRLEAIAETEFRMNYDFDFADMSRENLQIEIGHEINPDMDNDRVDVKAKVTLSYGDGGVVLASNTILMTFGLSPIGDVIVMKDDGTFASNNMPVINTFLFAAIGALRGVFMKNLKGTPLSDIYIPMIPADTFTSRS